MIFGIGTDIVRVARLAEMYARHGERALDKILAASERQACLASIAPERFLAKRFAAKEAFGKALGTGVRAPALLPSIAVAHDAFGKPVFEFAPDLATHLSKLGLVAHLSLSDEQDSAVAFVILEKP
ncbi:MAG: holo-ACP synthase [Betaproteobacteria bacterium]|nr:holo-ACP synthase [Betaproteobacteria bacterium]